MTRDIWKRLYQEVLDKRDYLAKMIVARAKYPDLANIQYLAGNHDAMVAVMALMKELDRDGEDD